jgi:hypothetical protein
MNAPTSLLPGKFVWFEHSSPDPTAAGRFYGELFGWTVQSMDMGAMNYTMIHKGSAGIGGLLGAAKGQPSAWMSYMSVADVDAAAKAAKAAGAKELMAPTDFPPVGRGATLADPTGGVFSVWKSAQGDQPDTDDVPDGAWCWNELWTQDDQKALAFYEQAFGYTHDSMDMGAQGTYYLLKSGGKQRAGLMKAPEAHIPPMWTPYVMVAECDATLARAKKLGARELVPATDIPGIGRFAVVADPQGAVVAFINRP